MNEQEWREHVSEKLSMIPDIKKSVDALSTSINGKPEAPEKGFKVRLALVEQTVGGIKWFSRVVGVAAIGLVIKELWHAIK